MPLRPEVDRPEIVLLVGLPAAGKTTFFRERFAATHVHVSRDLMKGAGGPARQVRLVEDALAQGRSVVVDNTHPRRADREPLVALGRRLGARVVAYHFPSTPAECLARNRGREAPSRVPAVAIFTAAKRMEPPSLEEGFDALFSVGLASGRGFVVSPDPAASVPRGR